jgi:hypothetical protein
MNYYLDIKGVGLRLLRQLQNFSFQLPTYQGSVLEAFRRTKHGPVAKRQLVLQQAQFKNY